MIRRKPRKSSPLKMTDEVPSGVIIKTPEQIAGIRKSCQLAGNTLVHMRQFVQPGVTTLKLNDLAAEFMKDHGATSACKGYPGEKFPFPGDVCISVNDVICHGIPNEQILQTGDIVNIDVALLLDGYYGDTATMYGVRDESLSADAIRLIEVAHCCCFQGIKAVEIGKSVGNIGNAIAEQAHLAKYSVVHQFTGHGVGVELHEKPTILHDSRRNVGPRIEAGWVFTIEPMINLGKPKAVVDDDGWVARTIDGELSAQFEHTVAVTEEGVEILSLVEPTIYDRIL